MATTRYLGKAVTIGWCGTPGMTPTSLDDLIINGLGGADTIIASPGVTSLIDVIINQ